MSTINFTTEIVMYIPTTAFLIEVHPKHDHTKLHNVWHDTLAPTYRPNGPTSVSRKVNVAVKSESIGLTKGKKWELTKKQGPKKRFLSVEEWEAEILSRVDSGVHGKLKELVDEFKDVFLDTFPKGCPPKRDIVYEIRTEEGDKPPSRLPYRLGPADHNKMEERVKDLLAQGFIRPSASPYSVPIQFVLKKDGRWCTCMDYKALNK